VSRVWIDIDNSPQVQYLLPFRAAFERLGAEVLVTARDYGMTLDLLREAGIEFRAFGSHFGRGRLRKGLGLARRSAQLLPVVARWRPELLVSSSRSSALVASALRLPAYVLCDYEHVDLGAYRLLGSTILHPDVIDAEAFRRKGFDDGRLLPFGGLKEDLSFARVDIEGTPPHPFPVDDRLVKVLFRPPAAESHYYVPASGELTAQLLDELASRGDAVVVFSPRYPWQVGYLEGREWANEPIVLDRPVPFVSLLKASDLVVSSGGTMAREAAYLGIPAYSIFQGEIGAVDRHLETTGRLVLLRSGADFERLKIEKFHGSLRSNATMERVQELARCIARSADTASRGKRRSAALARGRASRAGNHE
jgi:predicted glycosyltransferase